VGVHRPPFETSLEEASASSSADREAGLRPAAAGGGQEAGK
jgi:hypothetical protein